MVVQWLFLNPFDVLENYNIWEKSTIYLLFRSIENIFGKNRYLRCIDQ